ncbi:hypothetical protein B0H11DRAFT_2327689 [Mycena galericulata]|nr:hypothetical protein B0H11DRAFT_2327689 [Mycena galericulata]
MNFLTPANFPDTSSHSKVPSRSCIGVHKLNGKYKRLNRLQTFVNGNGWSLSVGLHERKVVGGDNVGGRAVHQGPGDVEDSAAIVKARGLEEYECPNAHLIPRTSHILKSYFPNRAIAQIQFRAKSAVIKPRKVGEFKNQAKVGGAKSGIPENA